MCACVRGGGAPMCVGWGGVGGGAPMCVGFGGSSVCRE